MRRNRAGVLLLAMMGFLVPSAASATVAPPSIPEPTGIALFAAGAAVVAIAYRLSRPR